MAQRTTPSIKSRKSERCSGPACGGRRYPRNPVSFPLFVYFPAACEEWISRMQSRTSLMYAISIYRLPQIHPFRLRSNDQTSEGKNQDDDQRARTSGDVDYSATGKELGNRTGRVTNGIRQTAM